MNQPSFSELLATEEQISATSFNYTIDESWMQGRTTYGGLSAALCLRAVNSACKGLAPLRSAQINFIGPVGGLVNVEVKVLRQGRSVSFVSAELSGETGIATHAVFCFGASRSSRLDQDFTPAPQLPGVSESEPFFSSARRAQFTYHFECLLAAGDRPVSGSSQSEISMWVRHIDKQANDLVALIGLADMPPPAVLPMFSEPKPISSMTWSINVLTEDIGTENGWWLLRTAAEQVRNGYSSQDMQVWNSRSELVITGRQSVAIFY